MKRLIKIGIAVVAILSFVVLGCGVGDVSEAENVYKVYYTDQAKTKLVSEDYHTDEVNTSVLIEALVDEMINGLDNVEYAKAIPDEVEVLWTYYDRDISNVTVSFSKSYYDVEPATEILCRAAVVRTLAQLYNIESVTFMVENNSLKDSEGNDISKMNTSMFIDATDTESLKRLNITLYFTDESGTKLIECDREVVCSSTVSNERLVLSQLIDGPVEEGMYPTLSSDLSITSLSVSDGICYVNLNSEFLDNTLNVNNTISVYSIVNTLTELSTVNKVQIVVDGASLPDLNADIADGPLDRNLDYVGVLEEEQEN